jgi:hypothetical protein
LFSRVDSRSHCAAVLTIAFGLCSFVGAQERVPRANRGGLSAKADTQHRAAGARLVPTIHWERVPLSEAIQRLKQLFDDPIFVDRRIDPGTRISLDIEATSAEEVVKAVAPAHDWAVVRLHKFIYLGPKSAAEQLRGVVSARARDVGGLPASQRAQWTRGEPISWARLSEPRMLISELVGRRGWRMENSDAIPHDLWAAGELPEMGLAEQLSMLLIGFDLTFKFEPTARTIEIVSLDENNQNMQSETRAEHAPTITNTPHRKPEGKHVYTLRVNDQPVRAILRQLTERLHWPIDIDEESIRAAGKSVDSRVSFSVENADQDQLLKAILGPAGLAYRVELNRVRISAARDK